MAEVVKVKGLRELQRAFVAADKELSKDLRKTLSDVAKPVRSDAERLALAGIPRIALPTSKIPWSSMRVGVTQKAVYVAPTQRATRTPGRKRKKFADLLMGRAMEPALERNESHIVGALDEMLDDVGRAWERV